MLFQRTALLVQTLQKKLGNSEGTIVFSMVPDMIGLEAQFTEKPCKKSFSVCPKSMKKKTRTEKIRVYFSVQIVFSVGDVDSEKT